MPGGAARCGAFPLERGGRKRASRGSANWITCKQEGKTLQVDDGGVQIGFADFKR